MKNIYVKLNGRIENRLYQLLYRGIGIIGEEQQQRFSLTQTTFQSRKLKARWIERTTTT